MESENQKMKKILIVPDKFKGSLTSLQAAQAIQAGFMRQGNWGKTGEESVDATVEMTGEMSADETVEMTADATVEVSADATVEVESAPGMSFQLVEIADGGDGSLNVMAGRLPGAQLVDITAHNPVGKEVGTQILLYRTSRAEKGIDSGAEGDSEGFRAGNGCNSGAEGNFVGFRAEKEADFGSDCCGSGFCAEKGIDSGAKGVSVGFRAGNEADFGSDCCSSGFRAGKGCNSGSDCCSSDFRAGKGCNSGAEGDFVGFRAEKEADSGSDYCSSDFRAGNGCNSGSEGDFVGFRAEKEANFGSDCCSSDFRAEKEADSGSEGGSWCAFIEMAKVSGLAMLAKEERNPLYTSTYGLGEAICAAMRMGAKKITLSIGGSATDDCGAGMLQAIGYQFFNHTGELIPAPICGKDLQEINRIEPPYVESFGEEKGYAPQICRIEVICDVDNPLLGENGATAVYAPQKGATPEAMVILEKGKANMAQVAERCLGISPQMKFLPGAGAAGGVGYAGTALLGGKLLSGWKFFTEITSLEEKVQWADVVVTGEGSVDSQSLSGKIVGGIMELARKYCKPVEIFCGISSLEVLPQGVRCHSLASIEPDLQVCMTHAAALLEKLAAGVKI